MESDIWAALGAARIATAINFMGGMIAIWIAARFASVAVEKGANVAAKVVITIFGCCVVLTNFWFMQWLSWDYYMALSNLERLRESGVELSVNSSYVLEEFPPEEPTLFENPVGLLLCLTALLVIIGTLWFQPQKDS
tara:strand:+ start:371 stop:781 length:411 start_codon:yes stop_codon:yes gene_type:complete